jgi:hypothetical protein
MVTERLNASKPQPAANDPKNARAQVNNNKDLDVDAKKEEPSFFGSFFSAKTGAKKKGGPIMEAPPAIIRPQAALSDRETMETEVISCVSPFPESTRQPLTCRCYTVELLIHSYFNIVKREMIDMVPKAISLTLVSHSKENLQRELLQELYKPEVLDDLLKESEFVVSRRKEVVSMVQALNKAEECVTFFPFAAELG